jgi:hypothetical protein
MPCPNSFFRSFGAWLGSTFHPRLAPWAAIFGRSAAESPFRLHHYGPRKYPASPSQPYAIIISKLTVIQPDKRELASAFAGRWPWLPIPCNPPSNDLPNPASAATCRLVLVFRRLLVLGRRTRLMRLRLWSVLFRSALLRTRLAGTVVISAGVVSVGVVRTGIRSFALRRRRERAETVVAACLGRLRGARFLGRHGWGVILAAGFASGDR